MRAHLPALASLRSDPSLGGETLSLSLSLTLTLTLTLTMGGVWRIAAAPKGWDQSGPRFRERPAPSESGQRRRCCGLAKGAPAAVLEPMGIMEPKGANGA